MREKKAGQKRKHQPQMQEKNGTLGRNASTSPKRGGKLVRKEEIKVRVKTHTKTRRNILLAKPDRPLKEGRRIVYYICRKTDALGTPINII